MLKAIFLAVLLIGASASREARAQNAINSTVHCNPTGAGGTIEYSQYGVHNLSTNSALTAECAVPVGLLGSVGLFSMVLTVYDRNSSFNVTCTVMELDAGGASRWSLTKASSGDVAGPQQLSFPLPATARANSAWRVSCFIPPSTSSGFSHLSSIYVTQ
jgi:hypothetical protein